MKRLPETHAGALLIGTILFGGLTGLATPQMWTMDFPGTLIPFAACLAVGVCFGEGMWHVVRRTNRGEAPFVKSDLQARPGYRLLAGLIAAVGVLAVVGMLLMVADGTQPPERLSGMPLILAGVACSAYVALRGRAPFPKRFGRKP